MSEELTYLQLINIQKSFSGVPVLTDVNLSVKKGEVHCLCGENGAGKSTLMKILCGFYPQGQYKGQIMLNGEEKSFTDIRSAEDAGITIITQELEVATNMTVSDNVFLGHEIMKNGLVDKHKEQQETEKVLQKFSIDISPNHIVGDLGVGQRQLIAIAKALTLNAALIILDEPTAALSESETEKLFEVIDELKKQNVTCLYISHKLSEVMEIADTITILRDGETVISEPKSEMDEKKIIQHMVGRDITELYPYDNERDRNGEVLFSVRNWNAIDRTTGKQILKDISFDVRAGEILGISGLMGAGRTEFVMSLFGSLDADVSGEISVKGKPLTVKKPEDAIKSGLGLIVEDRKYAGLILGMSVAKNITLTSLGKFVRHGVLDTDREVIAARDYAKQVNVKTPSLDIEVVRLSGGNQQKVVIAKALMTDPMVLFMDEPTRGIDVGARYDIYEIMNQITRQGSAIIMVSSDLPEILGMSDRILVMREGRINGELSKEEADQELIMHYSTLERRAE